MALDIGTLVAKIKVDDGDFDKKTDQWSTKGAAIGSAFGNIAADAVSQVTNMLSDFVGEAMEASDATAKFEKTLSFAGLDTSTIDKLRASTQAYADETVYNLGDIQSITATLAANGVEGYDSLAMALGNLNAVAGGNAETFGRVGSVLTQTAGQGKLTTENWNQLTDAIPGASKKLQDALLNAGAYTGNFREAMEKGEITAEEFNAAIQQVGTDPVAVEAAKSVETFEGSAGNLAAAIQSKLVAALDMIKPIITDVTNGFAEFIANIESWTPVIAGVGAIILAVMAPAIWAAVTATWAWTAALLANPITWIILAIGLLVAGIVWLIMNWDTAVAWISEVWGGFISWITGVIDGFVAWWNEMWAGFAAWIGEVWVGFTTWISEVWNGFIAWIVGVGEGFLGWWNGIWAAVGQWISDVWNGFIGFIQSVWQGYVSWIMGIVNGVVNWWNSTWSAVGAFISGIWSGFVATITAIWNGYVSWIMSVVNGFVAGWNATWSRVGQIISDVWNNIVSFFQGIPGAINSLLTGAGQWLYNIGRDIIQGLWNGLKSIWTSVENWFNDTFGGIIDTVAGLFGIASPSRVFREFGQFIGMGLIEGLEEYEDPIDAEFRRMTDVPPIDVPPPPGTDGGGDDPDGYRAFHYHAAPNASFDAQEEFFNAMGSSRVRD
ncbi:tape measure protein [Microbacterium phage TurboVicky]|nr:tape measure protein [Microbacterium phage Typher]UVK60350.1 tape measure protein [Microbacterium phage TurboVicky]